MLRRFHEDEPFLTLKRRKPKRKIEHGLFHVIHVSEVFGRDQGHAATRPCTPNAAPATELRLVQTWIIAEKELYSSPLLGLRCPAPELIQALLDDIFRNGR